MDCLVCRIRTFSSFGALAKNTGGECFLRFAEDEEEVEEDDDDEAEDESEEDSEEEELLSSLSSC